MNPQNLYTDQEWEEVSRDLPKESDPFIQKYLQGREALIVEENKERSGSYKLTLISRPPLFSLLIVNKKP